MEQDLSKTKNTPKITAADVVEYLRNEPNFFSQHPEALTAISSADSDQGDGVINFQSVVINKLRDRLICRVRIVALDRLYGNSRDAGTDEQGWC